MTLRFTYNNWTTAVLGWHLGQVVRDPIAWVLTLDDTAGGDLRQMAILTLDDALQSDEYDPLLILFRVETEEQFEDIGAWGKSKEMEDQLTEAYKAIEGSARVAWANKNWTPTIDDI